MLTSDVEFEVLRNLNFNRKAYIFTENKSSISQKEVDDYPIISGF